MTRRRMLSAFKVGAEVGNYEDLAVLPIDVDPQVTLSRNGIRQPFYHIFEKDTVLVSMSGTAVLRLQRSSVNTFSMEPGDHVYVPAGTPHRIEPLEEGVMLRYTAAAAGLEAAAWYCANCGDELYRLEWEHDNQVHAPRVYAAACARFNASGTARGCSRCGTVAEPVDLDAFGWSRFVPSDTAVHTLVDTTTGRD